MTGRSRLSAASALLLCAVFIPLLSAQTGTAAQKAVRYQTECDAGNADRCNQLGIAYQFGLGVTADKAHATAAYAKADVLLESASGIVPAVLRVRHH